MMNIPPRQKFLFQRSKRRAYISFINDMSRIGPNEVSELSEMWKNIPFYPFDILNANAFYGHSHILKEYVEFPVEQYLKAGIQHGMYFGKAYFKPEAETFPYYFTWGRGVTSNLEALIDNQIREIGSPYFYAKEFLAEQDILSEKNRLGPNILFFPAHSTHTSKLTFNVENTIREIRFKYGSRYKIRACLYWKDCNQELISRYSSLGVECVTAGHIFDPAFYPRLKSLLRICDFTMSNDIGSFIGYSVYHGMRHELVKSDLTLDSDIGESRSKTYAQFNEDINYSKLVLYLNQGFERNRESIEAICSKYFGYDCIKEKDELLFLIKQAENLYNQSFKRKYFYL